MKINHRLLKLLRTLIIRFSIFVSLFFLLLRVSISVYMQFNKGSFYIRIDELVQALSVGLIVGVILGIGVWIMYVIQKGE